ncbi:MAG: ATP-binding protein [Actinomycetota bacterium]
MTSEAEFGVAVPPSEPEPLRFRVIAWSLTGITLGIFIVGFEAGHVREQLSWELLAWIGLGALVNLFPVEAGQFKVDMDLPIFLAAGFIYGPILGGLLIFVSAFDLREFRKEISITHALVNRAQLALSVMAGATVFALAGGRVGSWPWIAGAGFLALMADTSVNFLSVSIMASLTTGRSLVSSLGDLTFGEPREFAIEYAIYGFAGLLLAELYVRIGSWSLLAFSVPIYLAREALERRRRLIEADRALRVGREALSQATERIAEERKDERLRIAASLHDDVLQSLHYLTLHAQVVREDLRGGRLLQLDQDVPALVEAAQETAVLARAVIRDLRESQLGRAGLGQALSIMIEETRETSISSIESRIDAVESSPAQQLVLFQVAREALRNAVEHAGASVISVELKLVDDVSVLTIADNGCGFDSSAVDSNSHFGLLLMGERVEALGGNISVSSSLGEGTRIECRLA